MTAYTAYDRAYQEVLTDRAHFAATLARIANEIIANHPLMRNRVYIYYEDTNTDLPEQYSTTARYLNAIDELNSSNAHNSCVLRPWSVENDTAFQVIYADLLSARAAVDAKMVEIDDVLVENGLGAIDEAQAMKPDLLALMAVEDAALQFFNYKIRVIEGWDKDCP